MGQKLMEYNKQPYFEIYLFHQHRLISKKFIKDEGDRQINLKGYGYFNKPSLENTQYFNGYGCIVMLDVDNIEPLFFDKDWKTKELTPIRIMEKTVHPLTFKEILTSKFVEDISHAEPDKWAGLKDIVIPILIIVFLMYIIYIACHFIGVL